MGTNNSNRRRLTGAQRRERAAAARRKAERRKYIIVVLLLAGLALVAVVGILAFRPTRTGKAVTTPTGFSLPALNGSGYVTLAEFRGKPTVVNFFASWCSACDQELPGFRTEADALTRKSGDGRACGSAACAGGLGCVPGGSGCWLVGVRLQGDFLAGDLFELTDQRAFTPVPVDVGLVEVSAEVLVVSVGIAQ